MGRSSPIKSPTFFDIWLERRIQVVARIHSNFNSWDNRIKMWTRLLIVGAFLFVATQVVAQQLSNTRPKNCGVGVTYAKDCNTCTCATTPKDDKCSKLDCDRAKLSTTPRTPNPNRPGICPTKVTPRPGIDDCSSRNLTSACKVDKDCAGAKKCCENGCRVNLCRNAIYNYTS